MRRLRLGMMAGGVGLDPDAVAFLTAAGITNATITTAIDTLVTDLKGYGIWTKMLAIYPFVGGTATTHKFNLKNPADTNAAFRLSFLGGWTHTANGAKPNGTNAYADTFINTFNLFVAGNGYMSVYVRTLTTQGSDRYIIGNTGPSNRFCIIDLYAFGASVYATMGGAIFLDEPTAGPRGFLQLNNLSGAHSIRKNTVVLESNTNLSGLFADCNIFLGAANNAPSFTPSGFSDYEQAFASVANVGLTNTELTNYYSAVQAFQTTLNRQV